MPPGQPPLPPLSPPPPPPRPRPRPRPLPKSSPGRDRGHRPRPRRRRRGRCPAVGAARRRGGRGGGRAPAAGSITTAVTARRLVGMDQLADEDIGHAGSEDGGEDDDAQDADEGHGDTLPRGRGTDARAADEKGRPDGAHASHGRCSLPVVPSSHHREEQLSYEVLRPSPRSAVLRRARYLDWTCAARRGAAAARVGGAAMPAPPRARTARARSPSSPLSIKARPTPSRTGTPAAAAPQVPAAFSAASRRCARTAAVIALGLGRCSRSPSLPGL